MVIQVPGGDNRPYQAPVDVTQKKDRKREFFIRLGSETIKARGDFLRQLMELAAKIPFDDRKNHEARIEDLSPHRVRRFLHNIQSNLADDEKNYEDIELYRKLQLITRINDHEVPRNVSLLFFTEDPSLFFRGAKIEVVQFGDDAGGDIIEERVFKGPINQQINDTLQYLNSLGGHVLTKISGQAEVEKTVPYPYEAMEEAIVNALYHRGYDAPPDPITVYLYPDRMQITSYPGPVPGISPEHLDPGQTIPPVPARNRRIGEFLKELRLAEGRGTGIPKIRRKMKENGSPDAIFDFDKDRTYFRVILPVHPRYLVVHALRGAAYLWATGKKTAAIDHLERAFKSQPSSGALASQLIEYSINDENLDLARTSLETFEKQERKSEVFLPFLTMARLLLDRSHSEEATVVLNKLPLYSAPPKEKLEAAILRKRARHFKEAHQLFEEAYAMDPNDPKLVHEFAQTKIELAKKRRQKVSTKQRLNREASELLRRAIQLSDSNIREAWCWYDLARTIRWLRAPVNEIEQAYLKAIALLPTEKRFEESYKRWKESLST